MSEFNLNDIYRQAFGYNAPKGKFTIPPAAGFTMTPAAARIETAALGGRYYDTDIFGREFFFACSIRWIYFAFCGYFYCLQKNNCVYTYARERGNRKRANQYR